jgi:hypothetical protein
VGGNQKALNKPPGRLIESTPGEQVVLVNRIAHFSGICNPSSAGDGFILLISNVSSDLLLAAEVYAVLGYSVIPLLGNTAPDRPKAPAVPWLPYQSRRAGQPDFERWFVKENYQGIAVVTGRISSLAVLDFDDPALFQRFSDQYPHLAGLQVIQTRRGCHIYYQLPPYLNVPTRKVPGLDLLAEGCYAVARPTTIAGFTYHAIAGGMPHVLTAQDVKCITAFLDQHTSLPERVRPPVEPQAVTALAAADLHALYRAQVGEGRGRNRALFNVGLIARDHGWSQAAVTAALADLHAWTTSSDHPPETNQQRCGEARRTIQSVFSRPPRPPRPISRVTPQLPTRAREMLYSLKLPCIVRVVEGLRDKGIQPGQTFTRQQARLLLLGIVGRDSLHQALQAAAPDGQPLFERAAPPLEPPPASVEAASGNTLPEIKKCFFDRATKSGKIRRGRKPHQYIMPTNAQLCRKLGIRPSTSDPLQADDLISAKKTRQAVHREFIRRRPGQYPRAWLAKRLGVSIRTTQRYDQQLHLHVYPMYAEQPISWSTLNAIPDFPLDGTFLEDEKKRRYPARRAIATHLLSQGHVLTYKRQQANFYTLDPPQVAAAQIRQLQRAYHERQEQIARYVAAEQEKSQTLPPSPARPAARPRSALPPDDAHNLALPFPEPAPTTKQPKAPQPKAAPRLSKRHARQPLANAAEEALAQRVYTIINARTGDRQHHISQATARRCVVSYGVKGVESALRLLLSRRNIEKPAGFLISVLRSESKRLF